MNTPLLSVLVFGLVLGVGDAKDDAKKEQKKLHGTWKAVTVEENGQSKEEAEQVRLTFSGDEFSFKKGDETLGKGKFKLDPSKKPKQIDLEVTEAHKAEFNGKTALGIYELKGDELKWCANKPGATDRPKEFSGRDGRLLVTFKRDKS